MTQHNFHSFQKCLESKRNESRPWLILYRKKHGWFYNLGKSYGSAKDCEEGKQKNVKILFGKLGVFIFPLWARTWMKSERYKKKAGSKFRLSNFICNYFCGMASKFALCLQSHFSKYSHNSGPISVTILPFTNIEVKATTKSENVHIADFTFSEFNCRPLVIPISVP